MLYEVITDCFYSMITARKIAETFNMVVVVLSDASLATSQQPFPRPQFSEAWMAPPVDQSAVPEGLKPYDWDAATGLARRFIPGQPGGMHTLTGLAHDRASHVAYDPRITSYNVCYTKLLRDLGAALAKKGIGFSAAGARRLHPAQNRIALGDGGTLDYDYLVITTGPKPAFDEVPGLGPLGHTHSLCEAGHLQHCSRGWRVFIENPGPLVSYNFV